MPSLHSFKLAGTVTLGPKGQVVIPADVREQMGIRPGDKLIALYTGDKQTIAFITEAQAQKFVDQLGQRMLHIKSALTSDDEK